MGRLSHLHRFANLKSRVPYQRYFSDLHIYAESDIVIVSAGSYGLNAADILAKAQPHLNTSPSLEHRRLLGVDASSVDSSSLQRVFANQAMHF
jgi:hypothetical protein